MEQDLTQTESPTLGHQVVNALTSSVNCNYEGSKYQLNATQLPGILQRQRQESVVSSCSILRPIEDSKCNMRTAGFSAAGVPTLAFSGMRKHSQRFGHMWLLY